MPSIEHEAPLTLLREAPELVPALLAGSLGVTLPSFARAEAVDADLGQVVPVERRADLVIYLRGGPPDDVIVHGIVVERQRERDEDKRYSWPLYVASLHDRLRKPTSLAVLTSSPAVARWAAVPTTSGPGGVTLQPLVLGPDQVPRVARARAREQPWLAVLSALIHGDSVDADEVGRTALDALSGLPERHATLCLDLMMALNEVVRRIVEAEMQPGKYEYKTEFVRNLVAERERHRMEGRMEGRRENARALLLQIAERRLARVGDELRAAVAACEDVELLDSLVVEVATAPDRETAAEALARLMS